MSPRAARPDCRCRRFRGRAPTPSPAACMASSRATNSTRPITWPEGCSRSRTSRPAARQEKQDNWGLTGTWTSVLSDSVVQEVKAGRYYYFFTHSPTVPLASQTTNYQFPGLSWHYIGTADNIPEEFWQDS